MDVFRSLGMGARFDKRRFQEDVKLFEHTKATKPMEPDEAATLLQEIDFFNNNNHSAGHQRAKTIAAASDAHESEQPSADSEDTEEQQAENDYKQFQNDHDVEVFRTKHQIRVYGSDVPRPFQTFRDFEQRFTPAPYLMDNLVKMGFKQPTPVQMQSATVTIGGRELIACAPTGSGKTLSFLLPMLHDLVKPKKAGFRAVIISPTRELAQQIFAQCNALCAGSKFKICLLSKTSNAVQNEDPKLRPKFDVLISTPLRLVHAIQQEKMDLTSVKHLILDEADKLLDLGFLEQMDEILAACSSPKLQKSLYSATMPSGVEQLAQTIMKDPIRVAIGTLNAATDTIKQRLIYVGSEEGKLIAIRQIIQEGLKPPVLIFVQSIERARELFNELIYENVNVEVIHSERTSAQRDSIVANFRSGRIWVLIATELMARGIDFKGVRLVINYDFPQTIQSYIHRIGRTGRAGREGEAITLFTNDDSDFLRNVVNVMKASGCDVPDWMLKLKKASKDVRYRLRRNPVERKAISTRTSYDKRKAGQKRDMIEASKRRKLAQQASAAAAPSSDASNKAGAGDKSQASAPPTTKHRRKQKQGEQ